MQAGSLDPSLLTLNMLVPMKATCLILSLLAINILGRPLNAAAQFSYLRPGRTLSFVENKGQIRDQYGRVRKDIGYQLRIKNGFSLFIGPGLMQYQWSRPDTAARSAAYSMRRLDMRLVGANPKAEVQAEQKQNYQEHFYLSGVAATVKTYRKITYRNIYPNIDWVVYLKGNAAEYDFVVRPGGRVSDIRMQYNGAHSLRLESDGTITAVTAMGSVKEGVPACYVAGRKVASAFTLRNNTVGFRTAPYKGTLIIDPALIWGTYLGGTLNEFAYGLATDKTGNVYVAGSTASTGNIATTGSYQSSYGGGTGNASYVGDAYLAKFSPSGAPLWITYYGGSSADQGYSVATDTANRVYLSGFTNSGSGIATTGAQQAAFGGGTDAFLACFDSTGSRQWATYFGGSGNENTMTSVCYSQSGNAIYMSGITSSGSGIATTGAQQAVIGGATDAFLAKYSLSGSLLWATYYGGTGAENNYAQVAADRFGNTYLCGITSSAAGISTTGSHQASYGGGSDGFLVKFNAAGARQWATYYGGSAYDRLHSVVCNDSGHVYGLGSTLSSTGIATSGSHQASMNSAAYMDNQFLVKFDSSGVRQWATYYGGNQYALGVSGSLSLGITGNVYFTGFTNSTTGIASPGTLKDTLTAGDDAYLVKFSPGGQRLWGTYYGGGVNETGRSTATDRFGNVYICGETGSGTGIATTGAYQGSFAGGNADGFLVKFNDCDTPAAPAPITGTATVCKGSSYTYSIPAMSGALSYSWSLPKGWSGAGTGSSITVRAGSDTGRIQVYGVFPCMNSPVQALAVSFLADARISPAGSQAVCSGDTLVLHAPPGAYTYQWLDGGKLIAGATDSTFRAWQAGRYAVVVTGSGCADTSAADTFTVHALPVPVIAAAGTSLSTGGFAAYQWYFNGVPVTGADAQSYTAPFDGDYSVKVQDANGCTGMSAVYHLQASGIGAPAGASLRLYPNSSATRLFIDAPFPVAVAISSLDGRVVMHRSGAAELDLSSLAAGVYLVRVTDLQGHLLRVEKFTIGIR